MSDPANPPQDDSQPPIVAQCLCATCGAVCDVTSEQCWMCLQHGPPASTSVNPYAASQSDYLPQQQWQTLPQSKFDGVFQFLLLLCVVLTVLVGIGLGAQDPGALIGFLILVGPAYAVTGIRAIWQTTRHGKASPKSLFLSLIISFTFTIAALITLAAAGIILLVAMCFRELSK